MTATFAENHFNTFATWYQNWAKDLLGLPTEQAPISSLYESYIDHCAAKGLRHSTAVAFAAILSKYADVGTRRKEGRNSTQRVASARAHFVDVLKDAGSLNEPARLIKTYDTLDIRCLDDKLLAVMQTIEDGLIAAGFTPNDDYTRKDLFVQAMPIITADYVAGRLDVTISYPSPAGEHDAENNLN